MSTGHVRCWGNGAYGQLGLGRTDDIGDNEAPSLDTDLGGRPVVAITTGAIHTCVLFSDAGARCWGSNGRGQLGLGHLDSIGDDEIATVDVDLGGSSIVAISTGDLHTCALLSNGRVRCWGEGRYGQLGLAAIADIGDDELPTVDVDLGVDVTVGPTIPTTIPTTTSTTTTFTTTSSTPPGLTTTTVPTASTTTAVSTTSTTTAVSTASTSTTVLEPSSTTSIGPTITLGFTTPIPLVPVTTAPTAMAGSTTPDATTSTVPTGATEVATTRSTAVAESDAFAAAPTVVVDTTTPKAQSGPTVAIASRTPTEAQTITLDGTGFAPDSSVTVELHSNPIVLGVVRTDATGAFTLTVTIPLGIVGQHTIVALGVDAEGQPNTVSAAVTVKARPADVLALTGGDPARTVTAGVTLLLLGLGALLHSRTRSIRPRTRV